VSDRAHDRAPEVAHEEYGEYGVYVHVPFCRERCDYCAFATYTDRDHLMERYSAACIAEIRSWRERGALPPATSVFFGGGTPSRLPAEALCEVLAQLPLAPGAEVTVECNPEDASVERLMAYRRNGVNRVSFGIQSTSRLVLQGLGRRFFDDAAARVTSAAAEAGFATYNVDLIFGAPSESDEQWERTLREIVELPHRPPHLSAYALTVEPGTPLAADAARHPDDDRAAQRYETAERVLSEAGYHWEEISNWALPGHECRHNHLYWRQGDYLGIGSAAHSHRSGHRWWNVRTPDRYIAAVEKGSSPLAGEETLDPAQQTFERLALALRTRRGVHESALPDVEDLRDLVERSEGRAVLTVRGRLLANAVTSYLGPEGASQGSGNLCAHAAQ
jgi:oxygen-independent coproporphyrinogen-3 oxidase